VVPNQKEHDMASARLSFAKHEGSLKEFAPGVTWMTAAIVNLHTIDIPQRNSWVLIDTGLRISSGAITGTSMMQPALSS
jgi:hypothetical protein